MPRSTKRTTKTTTKGRPSRRRYSESTSPEIAIPSYTDTTSRYSSPPANRWRTLLLGLLVLLALGYVFRDRIYSVLASRGIFLAAVVNGQPITRSSLDKQLEAQYGSQALDDLISRTIVEQEIQKQHIVISNDQVNVKIDSIKKTLPQNMTLDQALKMQGLSLPDFQQQVKIQLALDQILSSKIQVTDSEISDYIATNSSQFKGASPSAAYQQAKTTLQQQKSNQVFQSWFATLRQSAKITQQP
jgi:hypothetical protein